MHMDEKFNHIRENILVALIDKNIYVAAKLRTMYSINTSIVATS